MTYYKKKNDWDIARDNSLTTIKNRIYKKGELDNEGKSNKIFIK